jgi:hypothetical protein
MPKGKKQASQVFFDFNSRVKKEKNQLEPLEQQEGHQLLPRKKLKKILLKTEMEEELE